MLTAEFWADWWRNFEALILPSICLLYTSSQAGFTAISYTAAIWLKLTAHYFEEGCFTTTIHSNQTNMGSILDSEIKAGKKLARHKRDAQIMASC